MRCLRLLLLMGVVAALAAPAWAITLRIGTNVFHIEDRDNGTVYGGIPGGIGGSIGTTNNPGGGVGQLDAWAAKIPAAGGWWPANAAPGWALGASEDSWGIAFTDKITDLVGNEIWNKATSNTELTWVFYGAEDFYAENLDLGGNQIQTASVGLRAELWEEPTAGGTPLTVALINAGSGGRTALNAYTGATEGTNLLILDSTANHIRTLGSAGGPATEFETEFNSQSNKGSGVAYFDVIGGTMQVQFNNDEFFGPAAGANGVVTGADAWITFEADFSYNGPNPSGGDPTADPPVLPGNPPYDWLVTTTGRLRTDYVPEPVTMAGLLLGIGCLGRYVRRRR